MKLAWTEDLPSWTQVSKMTPSSSVELSSPVTRWTKLGQRPMPQGRVVTREVLGEAEIDMHLSGKNTGSEWVIERIFPLKEKRERKSATYNNEYACGGSGNLKHLQILSRFPFIFGWWGEPLEIFFKTGIVFCHCSRMIRMK